jgi:hypothetical protein
MPGPYKEAARRLHEMAQSQQGFFTAALRGRKMNEPATITDFTIAPGTKSN